MSEIDASATRTEAETAAGATRLDLDADRGFATLSHLPTSLHQCESRG